MAGNCTSSCKIDFYRFHMVDIVTIKDIVIHKFPLNLEEVLNNKGYNFLKAYKCKSST